MSGYFQWLILSSITGSPLGSALFLLIFWLVVDRFTLGILPDPVRWVMKRRREGQLRRTILGNPHDNRARRELAELLVARGRYSEGVELMKPVLEGGADDVQSVFVMAEACLGAGYVQQGDRLMGHARELDPNFRMGEIDLVVGRFQLKRKEFAAARVTLESLVKTRSGTIQGRVMLAQAMLGAGDDANAALMMDQAWNEYVSAPGYQRRRERWWAWRARPSRPIAYAALILVALVVLGTVVGPKVTEWQQQRNAAAGVPWVPHPGAPTQPYPGTAGADDREP